MVFLILTRGVVPEDSLTGPQALGAPSLNRWASVVAYLLATWGLSAAMRSREAFELRRLTALHNEFLSLGSLAMCAGTAAELVRRHAQSGGLAWFFCEGAGVAAEGPLYFWSYVYYLSKYYEMLDTALVLLQKSRVPNFGLQVYHHAAWGGLLFNTFVHVVMYQYYACRVLGIPTPWKRWITKLQIVQFVTSFFSGTLTPLRLLMGTLYLVSDRWARGDTCAGMGALLYNCLFNATLLLQFVGIDKRNSRQEEKKKG
ncbi:unnamed protein product [Prorocentrum cordatum]|uniref:Elongation of fatty acids protein n=1 Tax=Prorocentrum cordatum TaxID=2364126 RepID=A0ABN9VDI3_9DINO|nr:unnamed protein product [Polarella glacialis]